MPRKKIFMVIAAICWVVVLAFGPKTMTQQHQKAETPRSSDVATESKKEAKAKKEVAKPVEVTSSTQQVDDNTTVPEVNSATPANSVPQSSEPVVTDPAVVIPVQQIIRPKPEVPPIFPPACGGCGRILPKNSLTIRCPMYEMPNSYVCIM